VVTSALYFLIFGAFLGERIGSFNGVPYVAFVIPGLIMLSIVTNAYSNVSFTFFTSKFFARSIEEILVSPTPPWLLVAGFVGGGIVRGLVVGLLVLLVSLLFTHLHVAHVGIILLFAFLTSLVFSLGGLINGIYAKSIDGINIVPTFVLTPLVYLGGVFYSTASLPEWAQHLTLLNPLFYIINGFRYGFLGISDVPVLWCFAVLMMFVVVFSGINWYFLKTGLGLKQ